MAGGPSAGFGRPPGDGRGPLPGRPRGGTEFGTALYYVSILGTH